MPVTRLAEGNWSAFGAADMAGNVWEWVAERYGEYAAVDPHQEDPAGPAEGVRRVQRGGGFDDVAAALRSARRARVNPRARLCDVGCPGAPSWSFSSARQGPGGISRSS